MQFIQHASSSSGNLYEIIATNGKRLLIDPGVPWAKLIKSLGFDLGGIEACLVTHEHQDHCKSVGAVMSAGIDVFASTGTFEALHCPESDRRAIRIESELITGINSFEILCFDVIHDAAEPLGFVIQERATGEFLLFVTDSAFLEQQFSYPFGIIAIGCSYDMDILQERVDAGTIDESLAKRLLTSHSSKQWVRGYLRDFCDRSKLREIHLLHCSGENLDKEATRKEIEAEFFVTTK